MSDACFTENMFPKQQINQENGGRKVPFPYYFRKIYSSPIILFLTCGQSCGINLFCETIVTIAIYPKRKEASPWDSHVIMAIGLWPPSPRHCIIPVNMNSMIMDHICSFVQSGWRHPKPIWQRTADSWPVGELISPRPSPSLKPRPLKGKEEFGLCASL